ncbi:MAG: CotH kinase family protein [Bacteroidales bacterium]|nr:CotH kinase family protein [Bacteroidales bacterium]
MKKNIQRFTQCNFKRTKVKTSFLINLIITLSFLNSSTANAQEEPDIPIFSVQPMNMCLQKDESCTLTCMAEHEFHDQSDILYRWYVSSEKDNLKEQSPTAWSSSPELAVEPFSEKGIRYYLCETTIDQTNTEYSDVVAAAHTGLPILYINTEIPLSSITKDEYAFGNMKLVSGTDVFDYAFKKEKNGEKKEGIKGRGNSSWNEPKKGYNLKFDKKQSFFGLPDSKKWCLVANYSDKTLLRNKYASILGTQIFNSTWNPSFTSVDWIVNGEYLGNYLFCEKISIGNGRVNYQDISDYTEDNIATNKYTDQNGDGVIDLYDGGFVLEVDFRKDADFWWKTSQGVVMVLKEPDEIEEDAKDVIKNIVKTAEDALYSSFFTGEDGWRKYIDEDAVIDWYIVNEFGKDHDAQFHTSVYICFNPTNGKLYLGPNWDFDHSFGNNRTFNCDKSDDFFIKDSKWISRMFDDPVFVENVKKRWNDKKEALLQTFAEEDTIQTLANGNAISAELNFLKWKILGKNIYPNPDGYTERTTYQSEIDYMKNWLNERFLWLDNAINNSFSITYNLNGGTLSSSNPEVFISKSTAPFTVTNPTKDGYMFAGWIGTGLDGLTETINISDDHLGDKEFTAVWLKRKDITLCDLTIDNAVFSGEAETPIITLTDSNLPLISSIDYTVTLPGDCVNVGEYTVTITGIGKYIGTLTKTFSIIPKSNTDQENTTTPVVETAGGAAADKVWAYSRTLFIESVPDSQYKIIDLNGRTIAYSTTNSSHEEINIAKSGIFIVAINNHFYKVIIQ